MSVQKKHHGRRIKALQRSILMLFGLMSVQIAAVIIMSARIVGCNLKWRYLSETNVLQRARTQFCPRDVFWVHWKVENASQERFVDSKGV